MIQLILWKCVLKSMFILLFTKINNEQSSIAKYQFTWRHNVCDNLLHKVGRVFVFK